MNGGLEVGGPVCDIPGPAQGVWLLGQVQVHLYPGRLRHGPPSLSAPPELLEEANYGGKGGRILRDGVSGIFQSDAGKPALPHHIQCGGGSGGAALGDGDGGGRRRAGQEWTRG